MTPDDMPKVWVVYNPTAGRFPAQWLVKRAVDVLRRGGWDVRARISLSGPHLSAVCRQAVRAGCNAVLVAGGDGSVGYAVAGLLGSQTALGVLPAGTANVWAQELGLPILSWTTPRALEHAARRLMQAVARPVDVGLCNEHPFLLWAGGGLDGYVVHQVEPRPRWEKHLGVIGYAASVVRAAVRWPGTYLRVQADGEHIEGNFLLAIASNIRSYAGGIATLSPNARLDDGWMELWLFSGEGLRDTVRQAADLLRGQHVRSKRVRCLRIREATLESDAPLYFQLDGEPLIRSCRVALRVLPQALRVLVPASAHRFLNTIPQQRSEGSGNLQTHSHIAGL